MSKARSKAEKLKRRRGRPKLPPQAHEPSGRPSRRQESVKERIRGVAINARKRIYGLADEVCERPEAGYLLGRLFLAGLITHNQLSAGNRMAEDFARYYGLTGIPFPSTRSGHLFATKPDPPDPRETPLHTPSMKVWSDEERGEAARHASNVVMGIEAALGRADESGRPVTSVTKRVCVQEDDGAVAHPHMITFLRRGLDALLVHFSGGA